MLISQTWRSDFIPITKHSGFFERLKLTVQNTELNLEIEYLTISNDPLIKAYQKLELKNQMDADINIETVPDGRIELQAKNAGIWYTAYSQASIDMNNDTNGNPFDDIQDPGQCSRKWRLAESGEISENLFSSCDLDGLLVSKRKSSRFPEIGEAQKFYLFKKDGALYLNFDSFWLKPSAITPLVPLLRQNVPN